LARLTGWFFHKPKPEVVHAPPPIVRHQPDPPAVVLSCERCGFDYTITESRSAAGRASSGPANAGASSSRPGARSPSTWSDP